MLKCVKDEGRLMKARCVLIIGFVLWCGAVRQMSAQASQITGIGHIAYRATDLDKEVAFFQKLGFEQAFANISPEGKVTESFIKVNDHQFIEVYPPGEASDQLGWMHVCYESADLNALFATLDAHGLKPSAVRKAGAGNLLTVLRDPEDRTTEFTQYMPGSRHMLDQGKHLGEHRVSDLMAGFELPVPDLETARRFYVSGMGFEARGTRNGLRITAPGAPEMQIQIRAAVGNAKPATIFRVGDVAAAAKQLRAAGLSVTQERNRVTVADPDGNVFVFVAPRMR
jgi:catechol 2,3-dioxygenase-like lactoylglutathione lyase family enzyme